MAIKTVTELKEHWLRLMRKAWRETVSKRALKELVKRNTIEPARLQPGRENYRRTNGRAETGWSQRPKRQRWGYGI